MLTAEHNGPQEITEKFSRLIIHQYIPVSLTARRRTTATVSPARDLPALSFYPRVLPPSPSPPAVIRRPPPTTSIWGWKSVWGGVLARRGVLGRGPLRKPAESRRCAVTLGTPSFFSRSFCLYTVQQLELSYLHLPVKYEKWKKTLKTCYIDWSKIIQMFWQKMN